MTDGRLFDPIFRSPAGTPSADPFPYPNSGPAVLGLLDGSRAVQFEHGVAGLMAGRTDEGSQE